MTQMILYVIATILLVVGWTTTLIASRSKDKRLYRQWGGVWYGTSTVLYLVLLSLSCNK